MLLYVATLIMMKKKSAHLQNHHHVETELLHLLHSAMFGDASYIIFKQINID